MYNIFNNDSNYNRILHNHGRGDFGYGICSIIFWKGENFHNILEASNIKCLFQNFIESSKKQWNINTKNKIEKI